jgi:hypothetical protein
LTTKYRAGAADREAPRSLATSCDVAWATLDRDERIPTERA